MKPNALLIVPLALLPVLPLQATSSPPSGSAHAQAQKAEPKKSGSAAAAPAKAPLAAKKTVPASTRTVARKPAAAQRTLSQQQPSPERIREIQRALTDHGYPVEPTGVWGPQSMEALKKFQEARKINNMSGRGKLDPLTLIALGLGPRREPPQEPPVPPEKATTEGKKP